MAAMPRLPPADFREPHLRHADFLGAFAIVERERGILMVQNERRIAGRAVLTWDLPGGQVEPGELLGETLAREVREETGLALVGAPRFEFVQEGERILGGERQHGWRSFFFTVGTAGEPRAGGEVLAVRWLAREELDAVLSAPYHDSFRTWLAAGGSWFRSVWRD